MKSNNNHSSMPYAALRACNHPGCRELVKSGYCEAHRKQRNRSADQSRNRGKRFYDKRAWRDGIRPMKLSQNPLCEICLDNGKLVDATDVDHIDGNSNNNSVDNLQSLCHSCHSRKTARQDGAFTGKKS